MKNRQLILIGLLLSAATGYSALLNVDFESDTVGEKPASADLTLATVSENISLTVIDSTANKAGTGNGVELTDVGVSPDIVRLGYDFTSSPAVRVDVDVARLVGGTTGDSFIFGMLESGGNPGSGANRFFELGISDNGNISYSGGTAGATKEGALALNTSYRITLYANDGNAAVTAGGRALAKDTADIWFEGEYWGTIGFRKTDTTDSLGRFAINTLSSATPGQIAVDNLMVTAIPEPSSLGMIGVVGLSCLFIRRRLAM